MSNTDDLEAGKLSRQLRAFASTTHDAAMIQPFRDMAKWAEDLEARSLAQPPSSEVEYNGNAEIEKRVGEASKKYGDEYRRRFGSEHLDANPNWEVFFHAGMREVILAHPKDSAPADRIKRCCHCKDAMVNQFDPPPYCDQCEKIIPAFT